MGKNYEKRACWTPEIEACLVELLTEHNVVHYRAKNGINGWTKEAWTRITEKLNKRFPLVKLSREQIKEHEQQLKKTYKTVHQLKNTSGMGWDEHWCVLQGTDEVWGPLIAADKNVKKRQFKSFMHYDKLFAIYDGKIAEGNEKSSTSPTVQVEAETANNGVQMNGPILPLPLQQMPILAPGETSLTVDDADVGDGLHAESSMNPSGSRSQPPMSTEHASSQAPQRVKKKQKVGSAWVSSLMKGYHEAKKEEIKLYGELRREEAMQRSLSTLNAVDPFSVSRCMEMVYRLSEFTTEEIVRFSGLFVVPFNRELFMSMTDDCRTCWLRVKLSEM